MDTCRLQIQEIHTDRPLDELRRHLPPEATVVLERTDAVLARALSDLQDDEVNGLLLARAFDGQSEVLLEHVAGAYRGRRVSEDESGAPCHYLEKQMLCFGKVRESHVGRSVLGEERVRSYDLPLDAPVGSTVLCRYRDYVQFDEDGEARVFGDRVVGFEATATNPSEETR